MGSRKPQDQPNILVPKKHALFVVILIAALTGYIIYRESQIAYLTEMSQIGIFYKQNIKGYKLDPSWEMTVEELRREKKIIDRMLIERGQHRITREQLGRQSWGFLHMITTTAPDHISEIMREQFNAFLLLFAKFYPCKLCSNYFIKTLKKMGQFEGHTKMEMMDYMCKIHNKVNKRLNKRQYDCDMVTADWGTCDCFSSNPINNLK